MRHLGFVWLFALTTVHCGGGGEGTPAGAGATGGTANQASGGTGAQGGSESTSSGGSSNLGGSSNSNEDFEPVYGRLGDAETTFTLPEPAPDPDGNPPAMYHPTLVDEFPEVDFATLDRLYIPAGEYRTLLLGQLPLREPQRPLVITNLGGQVKVGGYAANYVFSISGGKNWVLTGRYDPTSKTGDSGFRGHAEGAFANSQGTYGIFIDDAFSKAGLSGLAIGGGATDFELDVLEVARAEFAGIVAKTDDNGEATMSNVKIHDLYVHDTGSEGIYFGSTQAQPQHTFEKLSIYDNRFVRAGTEALQVGQQGEGCEIHHNVLGPGAVRWRSAFADYQDGNVQYGQRHGSSSFHHNVVVGTGDLFVEFFPTPVDTDVRGADDTVSMHDNYFADTSASGVYTHAEDTGVTFRFESNFLTGFVFNYPEVHPDATEPDQVFGVGAGTMNPHVLADNVIDAPYPFQAWDPPANVTVTNNTEGAVERVLFRDFMGGAIESNFRQLEWWTDRATRAPGEPVVVYEQGAFVMHNGTLYEAISDNSEKAPDENPDVWRALPAPPDDARLRADSPHGDMGIRWPPP